MKKIAVLVPLAWLGWLVLIDWVPMFPLNDLAVISAADRGVAAAANYPIPLLIAGAVLLDRQWSRIAAAVLSLLCLGGHLVSWWIPYFGPASAGQLADYQRYYADTLRFLPTAGHDVTIDVQHTVVGVLTLAMVAATLIVTIKEWPRNLNRTAPAVAVGQPS